MINIWNYKDVIKVQITDINGNIFKGYRINIIDSEDLEYIGVDNPEDTIFIQSKDGNYGFGVSEISEIISLD